MYRTSLAALLLAATVSSRGSAQFVGPPLTRLEAVSGALGERHRLFEQDLNIDACSLAKPIGWDSVSTSLGQLAEPFSVSESDAIAAGAVVLVTLRIRNSRSGAWRHEDWLLRLSRSGNFRVVSMRISVVGIDD